MIYQAALALILHDMRLIDRLNRPQPHGNCRELPIVGHQPRVGVRGEAGAADLTSEILELRLADHTFKVRSRIHARSAVSLVIHQITGMPIGRTSEEMVHTYVVERCARRKAGDMPAQTIFIVIGAHHHRHCVPANQ